LLISFLVAAQDEVAAQRRAKHYIGVQANQLFRQIFNFGGSTSPVNNPYLFTYAVNSVNTGWGFNAGFGYTHQEVRNEDPFNPIQTTIDDFFIRLGVERKVAIGEKWMTSYGLDILRESEKNVTEIGIPQPGRFETQTRNRGAGIGLRFTLNYHISEKVLLGTEATYYHKWIKDTRTGTNMPDNTEKSKDFTFRVPVALFLILKV
jgi:hypothetical protein